jgi:hypothetical protein
MRRLSAAIAIVSVFTIAGCGRGATSDGLQPDPAVAKLTMSGDGIGRPDPSVTPGSTFADVTLLQLCDATYAASVQQPSDLDERNVFAAYKLDYPASLAGYRLDKLIPATLGGTEAPLNLWPEPRVATTSGRKDELATKLHDMVCEGDVALDAAQSAISSDWYAAWIKYLAGTSPSSSIVAAPAPAGAPAFAGQSAPVSTGPAPAIRAPGPGGAGATAGLPPATAAGPASPLPLADPPAPAPAAAVVVAPVPAPAIPPAPAPAAAAPPPAAVPIPPVVTVPAPPPVVTAPAQPVAPVTTATTPPKVTVTPNPVVTPKPVVTVTPTPTPTPTP